MAANDQANAHGDNSEGVILDGEDLKLMISKLPKEKGWFAEHIFLYKGFWYEHTGSFFEGTIRAQQQFNSNPSDIILASLPKSGTTWLKALVFAIINKKYNKNNEIIGSNLLNSSPHECVPFLELYKNKNVSSTSNTKVGQPRIFATHMSITCLPVSILNSGCRIVYICRDPKDVFVSLWLFKCKLEDRNSDQGKLASLSLEEAFELFCKGVSPQGPYWDHVLGYWISSLEQPQRVLFLKYEELKEEPLVNVNKLARFLDCPFSLEETKEIVEFCSFESLSNLKVNKEGEFRTHEYVVKNNIYFRQGKVGDWSNHLTPEMAARIDQITRHKLDGSGLSLV